MLSTNTLSARKSLCCLPAICVLSMVTLAGADETDNGRVFDDLAGEHATIYPIASTDDDDVPASDDDVSASSDDDDPPPGKVAPRRGQVAKRKPVATKAKQASNTVRIPKFAPQKARPGYVIGRAVFADGRPVPKFRVTVLGWTGEIHLGPSGTAPNLGVVTGQNGRYAVRTTSEINRKPVKALVTAVQAAALVSYRGRAYQLEMHPVDGKRDGSGKNSFRGDSGKGVVRNFVLKLQGPTRGYEKNTPLRDSNRSEVGDGGYAAFYGGTVVLSLDTRGGPAELASIVGSTVAVTFTPAGSLMDGSAGRTIVRTVPIRTASSVGYYLDFRDIPLGDYTASASIQKADGTAYPLQLRMLGADWKKTAPVVFEPSGVTGHVSMTTILAGP